MFIDIQRVDAYDIDKFRTNGYGYQYDDSVKTYKTFVDLLSIGRYFNYIGGWTRIELSNATIKTLKAMSESYCHTGQLADTDIKIAELDDLFDGRRWFFKFSNDAPKDGLGEFPVTNMRQTVRKIVTSERARLAMRDERKVLYFKEFDDEICPFHEYRVFVHRNRITAISADIYHSAAEYMSDTEIKLMAINIKRFWDSIPFKNKIPGSYTMDINFKKNIKLIDFNPFGHWLKEGSALFDWKDDYNILYGNGRTITFKLLNV